jgi:fucose 4-O-acetylase-like acetyltransferase
MEAQVQALLKPAADFFVSLHFPEPIVHWGHPLMMGIVLVFMGGFAAVTGWRGRLATDPQVAQTAWGEHRKLVPWLYLFLALGYSGGLLSLVMQGQEILQSPHFVTGSVVLAGLTVNALLSLAMKGQVVTRTLHAYVGSATLAVAVVHIALGVQLGLSF